MICKKCGATIRESDKYCKNCGEKVLEINNQKLDNSEQNNNKIEETNQTNSQQTSQISNNQLQPKKTNKGVLIIAVLIGCIGVFVTIFIIIFTMMSANSEGLVCKSKEGNITIMYKNNEIIGYTAVGITYNLDKQKEYAKKVGIDAYIKEFSTWFSNNTSGKCTINGKQIKQNEEKDETPDKTNKKNITVGDEKRGYISIPSNWTRFYDIDGNNSLQYSLANVYIVTLDIVEGQNTAKEYASNFMYNKQNSSEVTDVKGATVTIGKNRKYTAYQVYMYYPNDSTYLITYWFEAEDGKVHYISLEGPSELSGVKLTDYTFIPESFSLTNSNL